MTVTGAGSTWTIGDSLNVGNNSNLTISSGGLVQVGNSVASFGKIDVSGGGVLTIGTPPAADAVAHGASTLSVPAGSIQVYPGTASSS